MTQRSAAHSADSQVQLDWIDRLALLCFCAATALIVVTMGAGEARAEFGDSAAPPLRLTADEADAQPAATAPATTGVPDVAAEVVASAVDRPAPSESDAAAGETSNAAGQALNAAGAEGPEATPPGPAIVVEEEELIGASAASAARTAPDVSAAPVDTIVPDEIERRIVQGGWVMGALFGCSLLVVAVAVERCIATRRALVWPARLEALISRADGVDRDALRVEVKSGASVGELLVRAGLRAEENGAADAAGVVAEIGLREVARLRTGLPLLATLANMATMLGLFGTVLGMIDAFELIAAQGTGDPRVVADGIFKALVTTAAGLGIGITALAIHAALGARVNGRVRELEDGLGAIFDPAAAAPSPANAS